MIISKINKLLILFIVLSLSLGQFGRLSIGGYIVGIYIWDLLISFALGLFVIENFKKFSITNVPMFYRLMFAFLIWTFITIINGYRFVDNINQYIISFSYFLRLVFYTLFGFSVYIKTKGDVIFKKHLSNTVVLMGAFISIFGFIQLVIFPDLGKLDASLLWDPHKGRLVSTILDPNFVAVILLFPIIFNSIVLFNKLKDKDYKHLLYYFFSMFVMLIAIMFTYSRSGWLALGIMLFIVSIIRYRYLLIVTILVFFSAYYFVPRIQTRISGITDSSDSFYYRYQSWENAIEIIKNNPIIGYGYNTYRYVQADYGYFNYSNIEGNRSGAGSDSSLLQIFATTGAVGLLIYVFAYLSVFSFSVKNYIKKKKGSVYLKYLLMIALVPALFIESQFVNALLFPQILILFMVFSNYVLSEN